MLLLLFRLCFHSVNKIGKKKNPVHTEVEQNIIKTSGTFDLGKWATTSWQWISITKHHSKNVYCSITEIIDSLFPHYWIFRSHHITHQDINNLITALFLNLSYSGAHFSMLSVHNSLRRWRGVYEFDGHFPQPHLTIDISRAQNKSTKWDTNYLPPPKNATDPFPY